MKHHSPRFLQICQAARAAIHEISPEDAARSALEAGITLVDVREDHEWKAGRIAGAVHLGRGVLERDVEARWPDPTTPLILYCGGGFRSALAARSLQEMGYTAVSSMEGGVRGWQAAGLVWDDQEL